MTQKSRDRITEGKNYRQNMMDKLSIESGQVENCRPEEGKTMYVDKLEARIESLKSMLDDMTEKSRHIEGDLRIKFDRDKEELNSRIRNLKAGLSEIREAGGTAWKEMSTGTSKAMKELIEGIKSAAAKF
ncbi:hypothetical protein [uncultured Desulfobacter sp.]|uniref:hypothetical protein n=1 Tax=uncultured Desulfobacter sp. TaxID=240139 RepID=UPI0029C854F9|nr:hypothetical protein [uncultured Desulfobacter sp.]